MKNESSNPARVSEGATQAAFCTTHWTVVLEATRPDSASTRDAFGRLYVDYWPPLYAFARRRGFPSAEAEDLTQNFFVRLLEKQALERLHREGGRFRSFLLGGFKNYLANEWDRAQAGKRGGGQKHLSLDAGEGETAFIALQLPDHSTPEAAFEERWVLTVLELVNQRLGAEFTAQGKGDLFESLRPFLQGDRHGPAYAEVGAQRGMSEGAIKVAVHRMRHRYGELLREEIARTVSRPEEIEEELRHLMGVLSR